MIKNCKLSGGEFKVIETENDQWALCKFKNSYVGALDVMHFNNLTADPISFMEFTQQNTQCRGQMIKAQFVGSQKTLLICQYPDKSIIDSETLFNGLNHPDSDKLRKYLGL